MLHTNRWILPILAVVQIVAGRAHELFDLGRSISERSAALETVLTPAGYAFSIWGVIYAGCLALAVYQALPAQQHREDLKRLRPTFAAALIGNSAWPLYVGSVGLDGVSVVIIFATLSLLLLSWYRWEAQRNGHRFQDLWLVRYPLSLFAGWVSAAAFVNAASVSKSYGVIEKMGEIPVAALLLVGCTLVAGSVCRTLAPAKLYAGAVVWALVGILMNRPPLELVMLTAVCGLVIIAAALYPASRRS